MGLKTGIWASRLGFGLQGWDLGLKAEILTPRLESESGREGGQKRKIRRGRRKNRSPKGNMWSAIPVALLCMIANLCEGKQGSGPEGDEVL